MPDLQYKDRIREVNISMAKVSISHAGPFNGVDTIMHKHITFTSPEHRSRRAIVLPPASALTSASTNVKVLR